MDHSIGMAKRRGPLWDYLSLFTSLGTLLCCALPSLLVLVGMGATVAGFLSAVPSLVTLSQHKNWVFLIAGSLIGSNFIYTYALAPRLRAPGEGCSVASPEACATASAFSRAVLWISAIIYAIGFFSAYFLGPLLVRFAE